MSKTQKKNGASIEGAAYNVASNKSPIFRGMFTIGEVAKASGRSKPTVTKYVEILVSAGVVLEQERDMRYCVKTTPRTFYFSEMVK